MSNIRFNLHKIIGPSLRGGGSLAPAHCCGHHCNNKHDKQNLDLQIAKLLAKLEIKEKVGGESGRVATSGEVFRHIS